LSFLTFDFENIATLNSDQGQSRSSKLIPFNWLVIVSCYCSIKTLSLWHTVLRHSPSKNTWPWNRG